MVLQYNLERDSSTLRSMSPFNLLFSVLVTETNKKPNKPLPNWLFWNGLGKAYPVFCPLNTLPFAVDLTRARGSGIPGLSNIPSPFPQYSSAVCHSPSLEKTKDTHLSLTLCYCMGLTGFSLLIPFLFYLRNRQWRNQRTWSDESLSLWQMKVEKGKSSFSERKVISGISQHLMLKRCD